jgi:CheY-like chemotaxis protein
MRILIVEDNRDYAQLMGDILRLKGCLPTVVPDAESGLLAARQLLPDLIFCDIDLPGVKSGLDFAVTLRMDQALAPTPLVAVTGHTSESKRRSIRLAGFDMVFAKPVKFADLTAAIEKYSPSATRSPLVADQGELR